MKYKAAIFDFDGTLLNTLDDLADSMNAVLEKFAMPVHPVAPYRYFVGDGMEVLARRAAPEDAPDSVIRDMAAEMDALYKKNWMVKTRPYDGVAELLAELKNRGLKVGLLSNKPDSFTQIMAKHYFADGAFDAVFGARAGVPKKPDPTGAIEIAGIFGIAPADILYLGDTNTDMKTGRAAGMFTIGVTWGFRPVTELFEAGAQKLLDKPAELLELL